MKKKIISFKKIAKGYSDPKQFEEDCLTLAAKMKVHEAKYGLMGIWVVQKMTGYH